jgi:hypothetical protein
VLLGKTIDVGSVTAVPPSSFATFGPTLTGGSFYKGTESLGNTNIGIDNSGNTLALGSVATGGLFLAGGTFQTESGGPTTISTSTIIANGNVFIWSEGGNATDLGTFSNVSITAGKILRLDMGGLTEDINFNNSYTAGTDLILNASGIGNAFNMASGSFY